MRTTHSLTISCSILGGCPTPSAMQTSIDVEPLDADPLDADPTGHVTYDACWEATPPPLREQTSFAGDKNYFVIINGYRIYFWQKNIFA